MVADDEERQASCELPAQWDEQRYRVLIEQLPAVLYHYPIHDAPIAPYISPKITGLTGYTPAELLEPDFSLLNLMPPDDRAAVLARARHCVRTSEPFQADYRITHRDGRVVWVRDQAQVVRDAAGQVFCWQGLMFDVTAEHEADAARLASEYRLAESQRIAHLGSWTFDFQRREVQCTDEFFRILGQPPQSFVPTMAIFERFLHPDDRQRVLTRVYEQVRTGEPCDLEARFVLSTNELRHVYLHMESVFGADGKVIRQLGIVQDITERHELEAQLHYQATHDPLTGLPNRTHFLHYLQRALSLAGGSGTSCAVLFLDLDWFKDVNDSLGHAAGDQLLAQLAGRLRQGLRKGDTLARLGGDEFAALLENISDEVQALEVANRLHASLEAPFIIEGYEYFATTSIGLALSTGEHSSADDLLRFADVALYQAKEAGRAATIVFSEQLNAEVMQRLEFARQLRQAIDMQELVLHYQPMVSLKTGKVVALEALVRWQHPKRGLLYPGAFIALAEDTGLIIALERWVLQAACRQLAAWRDCYGASLLPIMTINLSARQFRQSDLAAAVAEQMDALGLPYGQLMIEVTETVVMTHTEIVTRTLRDLWELGVRLALDDFGTGYSSLAYLQKLPVSKLKIDRTFFQDSRPNRAIVSAITDLAHGLDLLVVAEGLETPKQVHWAQAAGCDLGQGFLFAPALPAEALQSWWDAGLAIDLPAVLCPQG